ncbi:MAG: hypothetical protein CVU84_14065 [Firmicutes bacterium HGW-Firmicutes-1]|jgi:hypothetical protein|nr:MAG: hypothetical protein CVU84_14065 [Firmicutes bacterium HGW-Firmicutes-1]
MINDIYEQRKRLEEGYHITLSIPKKEYVAIYGNEINAVNAQEVVHNYLQHKDDDGEPREIKIYDHNEGSLIEIEAILDYVGNEHKDYDSRLPK